MHQKITSPSDRYDGCEPRAEGETSLDMKSVFRGLRPFILCYFRLLFVLLICASSHAIAQGERFNPSTVLVGRFTFTRPAEWIWLTSESKAESRTEVIFSVKTGAGDQIPKVFINQYGAQDRTSEKTPTAKRWKDWFETPGKVVPWSESIVIGKSKVSYMEITGTFRGILKKAPLQSNYALFGAIIEDPDGNILVRIMGPSKSVRPGIGDLKKMIEEALKEEKQE